MKNEMLKGNTIIKEYPIFGDGFGLLRLCGLDRLREANTGDEVNVMVSVCNFYDYPADVRVDMLTLWNDSSMTNYGTVPARPLNGKYSLIKIPFTFVMPDKPAAYCFGLFKKVNYKWDFIPGNGVMPGWNYLVSTTPIGYGPVIWDSFDTIVYPFVHKVGSINGYELLVEFGFTNLGNTECWQGVRAYLRWSDEWLIQKGKGNPWGTGTVGGGIVISEMPAEDAIIDFYLEHSENCDDSAGPYITTEKTTITIKPIFDPGTIHMKKVDTEKNLVPGTKPGYLKLSAVVPPVNKVHLFAKDSILDMPVSNILTVKGTMEGNIKVDIDPKTFFTKTMPNYREWHLELYGAADK